MKFPLYRAALPAAVFPGLPGRPFPRVGKGKDGPSCDLAFDTLPAYRHIPLHVKPFSQSPDTFPELIKTGKP